MPSSSNFNDPKQRAMRVAHAFKHIARLSEALDRRSNDFTAHKLNPSQWDTLRFLASRREEDRNVTSIANYVKIRPSAVSRTIQNLKEKNLVRLKSQARGFYDKDVLELTEDGRVLVEQFDPIQTLAFFFEQTLSDNPGNFRVLERSLQQLGIYMLEAANGFQGEEGEEEGGAPLPRRR
jgi:DNA-binding MarR family transcriptional regulator